MKFGDYEVVRTPTLVSVIVPARNVARTLTQQLEAISGQDYPGPLELIVAVNGGRDRTAEVAARWVRRNKMGRVIDASDRLGPGYARNRGVGAARGDFLAFCDADDLVSHRWLRELVASAGDADFVTGPLSAEALNSEPLRSCQSVAPPSRKFHDFLPIASTSNCGVWREVFDALGGFEEHGRVGGEDTSFSWRAQLSGYSLSVANDAVVHKRFRASRLAIFPQYFWYGIGDARLYSRFGPLGMPRRDVREALSEWAAIARGVPSLAGTPGRWGRVLQMAALDFGRTVGSVRYRSLFL
jgi:glycosyltransferase involved in cell wall biosynthesis